MVQPKKFGGFVPKVNCMSGKQELIVEAEEIDAHFVLDLKH